MTEREHYLEMAITAAVAAGNILVERSQDVFHKFSLTKESFRDIVTEADRCAETRIVEILSSVLPVIPILSEESGVIGAKNLGDTFWVVDPLDGTVNYINHLPLYAVSIALIEKGVPVVGVVYNPVLNELYYGMEGGFSYKNKQKIRVRDGRPKELLFAGSFSGKNYNPSKRKSEFITFGKINDITRGCLRTGSAAINLCYVADGKLGGCWGRASKLWDIAAGLLLAKLSGAEVKYEVVDKKNHLVNYTAAVSSARRFISKETGLC